MVLANAALLQRDLIPGWTAGKPPALAAYELEYGRVKVAQTGLFNRAGQRIGGIWTETWRDDLTIYVDSMAVLDELSIAGEELLPALRLDTSLHYNAESQLEELRVAVHGFGLPIWLHGEYLPPDDFRVTWAFGDQTGGFVLPAEATRAMGDLHTPFQGLVGLEVGQTWRHELLNPLSGILPGLHGTTMRSEPIIVQVTGQEKIVHGGVSIRAFTLEAENVRAWISPLGDVLRQELTLPVIGRLTLLDEPYDDNARIAARQRVVEMD